MCGRWFLAFLLVLAPAWMSAEFRMKTNCGYITGFAGASWIQDQIHHRDYDFKMGPIAGLAVGYKVDCGFRFEIEYSYRYNRFKHLEIDSFQTSSHGYYQTSAGLLNVFYDFWVPNTWAIPYIGFGLGYANQRLINRGDSFKESETKNSLAWQAGLGLDYIVDRCNRVGLGYRFFRGTALKLNSHSAILSWTYFL